MKKPMQTVFTVLKTWLVDWKIITDCRFIRQEEGGIKKKDERQTRLQAISRFQQTCYESKSETSPDDGYRRVIGQVQAQVA